MGYERSTLKLVFTDPELAGLEVSSRRLSLDALRAIMRLRGLNIDTVAGDSAELDDLFTMLAGGEYGGQIRTGVLLAWNLEDQGAAVPLTAGTLAAQDLVLVIAIIDALVEASTQVAPPLSGHSSSGPPSPEASIPMETLSASPLS